MDTEAFEEMGPVDYAVIEWPGRQPQGDVAPLIFDLVDRGLIRILDVAFLTKDDEGNVATVEVGAFDEDGGFSGFDGASSGLFGEDDLDDAATALNPGTSAAVIMWENRWLAPVAVALRKSGAQLVANGRVPVQAILASLEAAESQSTT